MCVELQSDLPQQDGNDLVRFTLRQCFGPGRHLGWIGMNPSRASDKVLDDSWKRMRRFSGQWGYGGLVVVNLVPYRSRWPRDAINKLSDISRGRSDSADLDVNRDKVGSIADEVDRWVAIWGNDGDRMDKTFRCKDELLEAIPRYPSSRFLSFGLTKSRGSPKHVLARDISYSSPVFEYDPWRRTLGPMFTRDAMRAS
ncbi:MAG: DUF1643 domain-containing protein [Caulobacteraceae bacterium]